MKDSLQFRNPITQLGWAKIDHVVTFDPTLSDGAYRTYSIMIYHAQQKLETYVSLDTVASERDLCRETISAHIKELEEHGLITRRPRVGTSTITEIEDLPKIYWDMAEFILYAREHKASPLEKPHGEENLTSPLEKPHVRREENLTRDISKESDIKNGAFAPDANELPSEKEIVEQDEESQTTELTAEEEFAALPSAGASIATLDEVKEALTIICETDKLLSRERFKKKQTARLRELLARDPTRQAFDNARVSFRQAVLEQKTFAAPDTFLGFYATEIDTLAIRAPHLTQQQTEFQCQTPAVVVYSNDRLEF